MRLFKELFFCLGLFPTVCGRRYLTDDTTQRSSPQVLGLARDLAVKVVVVPAEEGVIGGLLEDGDADLGDTGNTSSGSSLRLSGIGSGSSSGSLAASATPFRPTGFALALRI